MIRVKSIFGKLNFIDFSDELLFHTYIDTFSTRSLPCPYCGCIDNFNSFASYQRDMITVVAGSRKQVTLTIPRLQCNSCGHTHAILPDVLIPYGSYSLYFILHILDRYLHRTISVQAFCDAWEISISTLYGWIHLFEAQGSLWLGVLERILKFNQEGLLRVTNISDFPALFYLRYKFSFLQHHTAATLSRKPTDSS
ncbi:MAG: DUF6431 domain-containing protein [Eubacteriales bacterium]